MTRIIGGQAGGRRLQTPQGDGTRPTSDRVREALFSSIESWAGGSLTGLAVLDLYAGSGALGLEAWSRGAREVLLVERDRAAGQVVSANIRTLGAAARVVTGSVATVLARGSGTRYDVVLSDPPYPLTDDEVAADLQALVEHGWLQPDALVVVERAKRSRQPAWPEGLAAGRQRKYGETVLWFGHGTRAGTDDPATPTGVDHPDHTDETDPSTGGTP